MEAIPATSEQRAAFNDTQRQKDADAISRLAALTHIEYARFREEEAAALGVPVSALDADVKEARKKKKSNGLENAEEREPWDSPVDGRELMDEIRTAVNDYLILPDHADVAISLWVAFTYFLDHVNFAPMLIITSPERECGKSRVLEVLNMLVWNPEPLASITPAALYRVIEKSRPTLLVDEVDTFLKENDEARGILNCGHSRGTAYVMRVVGEGANMEPQKFSTWGAKALCGIETLKDTLTSRSIIIKMRRKKPDENVKPLRESQKSAHSHIRKMLVRFALDNADKVADAPDKELEMPTSLCDRDQDNWEPLFAIAEVVGGDWPKLARKAAEALSKKDDDSIGATLLGDIKVVFEDKGVNKLSTKDLIAALSEFEGKPWPEYNHGKEITPRQLASLLKPYDIKPKTERVGGRGGLVFKGYELSSFQDALSRYLPENAVTRLHGGGAVAIGNPQGFVFMEDSAMCNRVTDNLEKGGGETDTEVVL